MEANKELRIEAPPVVEAESSVIDQGLVVVTEDTKVPESASEEATKDDDEISQKSSTSKQSKPKQKKKKEPPKPAGISLYSLASHFIHVHAYLRDLVALS